MVLIYIKRVYHTESRSTIVFMLVILIMVVVVVAVVAGVVSLAFRVIVNYTLTICLILLVCLRFLWFVIRLYLLVLECLIRYNSINGRG